MHDKVDILSVGSESSDTNLEEVEEPAKKVKAAQVEICNTETPET